MKKEKMTNKQMEIVNDLYRISDRYIKIFKALPDDYPKEEFNKVKYVMNNCYLCINSDEEYRNQMKEIQYLIDYKMVHVLGIRD